MGSTPGPSSSCCSGVSAVKAGMLDGNDVGQAARVLQCAVTVCGQTHPDQMKVAVDESAATSQMPTQSWNSAFMRGARLLAKR